METVALSLVSHTNVGKTTLARTLLRKDVGTVFDQAHVTEVSEAWPLLEADGARLLLWDTPGFGDSARLLRRLRHEKDPLGWFLHQVWDRLADRPLWCSQEALRNVRQDADVVLYLVNAAEEPADAGYVEPELEILGWVGRPVLVLLNQTGPLAGAAEVEARWRQHLVGRPHVRGLLSLDAFTRCWVQEGVLLRRVAEVLEPARRPVVLGLLAAWERRNLATFRESAAALAAFLAETAGDGERLPSAEAGAAEQKLAMDALAERLEQRLCALTEALVARHGLDGRAAARLQEQLQDFEVRGQAKLSLRRGALWGGLVSGAATGVAADLATGGLSFGGGLVVGALLGALGGAGIARAVRLVQAGEIPAVGWSPAFLDALVRRVLLRYLAVAQFGRGRGAVDDDVLSESGTRAWALTLEAALAPRNERWNAALESAGGRTARRLWDALPVVGRRSPPQAPADEAGAAETRRRLQRLVRETLQDALRQRYPEADALWRAEEVPP